MNESRTIPREISDEYGKDYAFLRTEGLKYIERLAHRLWTDYNTHDPGVTVLEMLCYTITDLGYRIAMPMEDILARPKDNLQHMHEQFLSAISALPSCPCTADDFRQLFIRIEGVRNCWITAADRSIVARFKDLPVVGRPELHYKKPDEVTDPVQQKEFVLQGLNSILIDYDDSALLKETDRQEDPATQQQLITTRKKEINRQVLAVYHRFRNLCEDIESIGEVPSAGVVLCGDIDIVPNADPEDVWARIIFNINRYLAPDIPFYSLQEMQEMGKTTDEIFEGPVFAFTDPYPYTTPGNPFVKKGFICREDLAESQLRTEVRLSDLIRIIMNTEGVRFVKEIGFGLCDCSETDVETIHQSLAGEVWNLCIPPGHKPVLCTESSVLNFWKGALPIELKTVEARLRLNRLQEERLRKMQAKRTEDLPMPEGRYRRIGEYHSFQNDFPETYGIGRAGLPDGATTRRKAQARQMKGYLLFFEQVLANYFAQLEQVSTLFAADHSVARTYFAGVVQGLKDQDAIFTNAPHWQDEVEAILQSTGLDPYIKRKNMFLDHLLARFAEQFNEYVFLMYRLYGEDAEEAVIRHKADYLKEYADLSACRGSGFDYYNPLDDRQMPANVTGMEKRISRLLGFNHYRRQPLGDLSYEVFPAAMVSKEIGGVMTDVQGYGWSIKQGDEVILQSVNTGFIRTADAFEELGLASLLGCERSYYATRLNADQSMVSCVLLNAGGTAIAIHPKEYPLTEDELPEGPFTLLESAIEAMMRYFLEDFRLEGMHVVEHLLLRPDSDNPPEKKDLFLPVCIEPDGSFCPPLDPYSFRITVVLPGYSLRLRNRYFRRFAERLIRMETPAHVLPRICFVDQEHMQLFEAVYTQWLHERRSSEDPGRQASDSTLKALIEVLGSLYTIYEEGRLTDCDGDTPQKNALVLGGSMLGSLESQSQPD
ncbi:MAG: hypothetical protein GXY53_09620 [Desulfobulbus sp.]|nr:hypothetical protein [Desulfobulbus sp.]